MLLVVSMDELIRTTVFIAQFNLLHDLQLNGLIRGGSLIIYVGLSEIKHGCHSSLPIKLVNWG
jgi:hypothetical protein